jgi:hypothetical protein
VELPVGLDYAWLGCDSVGNVARFTNGGKGPIPAFVLAERNLADRAELLIRVLPILGKCELLVSLPNPSDFVGLAERGLFGYDWQDVARISGRSRCYEIVSRPLRPIHYQELSPELQQLATLVRFETLSFAASDSICVSRLFECVG